MRTILVDHHDSYTHNVAHLAAAAWGVTPWVVPHDDPRWQSPAGLEQLRSQCDAVLLSPGPGHPARASDTLGSVAALLQLGRPALGVCLGMQLMAHLSGLTVAGAPQPKHGLISQLIHTQSGLFADLPQHLKVVRYHSLAVAEAYRHPASLTPQPQRLGMVETLAWSEDGVCQGLRRLDLPWWGVQFHPESVASEGGRTVLQNFAQEVRNSISTTAVPPQPPPTPSVPPSSLDRPPSPAAGVVCVPLPQIPDLEGLVNTWTSRGSDTWWLDSSSADATFSARNAQSPDSPTSGRYSFAGTNGGALGATATFCPGEHAAWTMRITQNQTTTEHSVHTVWDGLRALHRSSQWVAEKMPADFTAPLRGGWVGYCGYECAADPLLLQREDPGYPAAQWIHATRYVAVDHHSRAAWAVAVHDGSQADQHAAQAWVTSCASRQVSPLPRAELKPTVPHVESALRTSPALYAEQVATCLEYLAAGESYELCLTTEARFPYPHSLWGAYRTQRHLNPVPYGAFLKLGQVEVACSSPERFLHVRPHGGSFRVETKPIKGTARRSNDPYTDQRLAEQLRTDDKTQAENLMIVDLLRNDLSLVCVPGSVTVPARGVVESYASVHHLVSTVQGTLSPEADALSALAACFPGGSMTGAPKERTMHLLQHLEQRPRGVYSGTIGALSADGYADLNIVIRTIVRHQGQAVIGAGGAVVLDSTPAGETHEMLLKLRSALRGVIDGRGHPLI